MSWITDFLIEWIKWAAVEIWNNIIEISYWNCWLGLSSGSNWTVQALSRFPIIVNTKYENCTLDLHFFAFVNLIDAKKFFQLKRVAFWLVPTWVFIFWCFHWLNGIESHKKWEHCLNGICYAMQEIVKSPPCERKMIHWIDNWLSSLDNRVKDCTLSRHFLNLFLK